MVKIRLGRTNLLAGRCSFGALPIQRIPQQEAVYLLQKAYSNGINFYDTARGYTDSEEKIGQALSKVRQNIIIATKTFAKDKETLFLHLETSLRNLKTDYIDIYQLHIPETLPVPGGPDGLYEGLLSAREKGYIRFISITNHRLGVATEAVKSGLYDTVQFPLSLLSSKEELKLIDECKASDVGLIAMKALSGGLITRADSAFAFLNQFDNVVPIWGIQKECELDEFLSFEKNPPQLDGPMLEVIEQYRSEFSGSFCRACGYCLPCPAGIPIPMAARMSLLLRRMPYQPFLTQEWQEKMNQIEACQECGRCKRQCPYELDTPSILRGMLEDYRQFCSSHGTVG